MSIFNSNVLTQQFYQWEQRGRGWLYHSEFAVDLEPPFKPFFFHYVPSPIQYTDDSRRPTIFDRIADAFKIKPQGEPEQPYEEEIIEPYFFDCDEGIKVFSISLPKGHKIEIEETEQLLLMLSYCQYPLSYEIVASSTTIAIQIVCHISDASQVASQVKAYFPDCILKERTDLIKDIITQDGKCASIVHFGLRDEFMRPLRMVESFNPDPLIGIFGSLEHLQDGEHAVIQILFTGARNPWAESIMRSVTDNEGKAFFENAPEMVPFAKEKISYPLFGVAMRILGVSTTVNEARSITDSVESAFGRIYFSNSNSLIPIQPNIEFQDNVDDIILRQSHLSGMLLNSRELATVVHLPSDSVYSQKLERDTRKTKVAPKITEGHSFILGLNDHQGKTKKVKVSASQRLRHTHLIGATGTGKSTLLQSMIVQDIELGNGVAVLDPHGDLIENILPHIPEHRRKDVLIIDPADRYFPVGFNFFIAHSEVEKDILSSDLVAVFKRLSTSWGDQMNSVLANAILAFLESSTGSTMIDLRRFLVEKTFRDNFLKSVSDPSIKYYWQKEYPLLKTNSIGPILTRLDTFLRPKLIRNMVAQKKGLDFENILDTQKILLIKLSQGLIGNENSYLLGTVIVSKIHQAAMARQAKEDRKDFYIYIDEFQNFITPSMSAILSGARKYHVGLVLAHQDMQQLLKYDTELASSIVSNAGTRICFRLGDIDARRFENGFSFFEARDFENLGTGEAICRIERPDNDFSLQTIPVPQLDAAQAEQTKTEVLELSRKTYGTPREEVEKLLETLITEPEESAPVQKQPTPQLASEKPTQPLSQPEEEHPKPFSKEAQQEIAEKQIRQKEESQHRYLQNLIKRMAESRGYKASVEEPTADGKGRVDVHLERNSKKIAVEVCVTTELDWEMHNIQKCLDAGYDLVVECTNDKKVVDNIKKKIETSFDEKQRNKVAVFEPEAFFQFLDAEVAKEASAEVKVKGYRVRVEYTPEPNAEAKMDIIERAIMDSKRQAKKKK